MVRALARLAVFPVLLAAAAASAQDTQPGVDELGELRELVLHARYEEVGPRLEAYLASGELSASQRVAALDLRAMVLVAERAEDEARATLGELYRRDPGHVPSDPEASPVVLEAFELARASNEGAMPVVIEASPWQPLGDGLPPLELSVTAHADAVHALVLFYRAGVAGPFVEQALELAPDGSARFRLPVERTATDQEVGYYVVAQAPSGHVLNRLGSEEVPRTLVVPALDAVGGDDPVEATPLVKQWWFWTIVGVVVVGAGVGVGVAASGDDAPSGTLGSGRLQ